jgi:hypothetical protein
MSFYQSITAGPSIWPASFPLGRSLENEPGNFSQWVGFRIEKSQVSDGSVQQNFGLPPGLANAE